MATTAQISWRPGRSSSIPVARTKCCHLARHLGEALHPRPDGPNFAVYPLICGSINGHNQKGVLVPGAQPKLMTWPHTTCSRVPLCCGCVSWTGCSSSTSACRASTKGCGPGRFSGHVGGGLCGASLSGFWVGWAWGPGGVRLGRAAAGAGGGLGCVAGCCLVIPAGIVARRGRARGG